MSTVNITLAICILALIYCVYQLIRNHAVYRIRHRWIMTDDERWNLYSYNFMFDPSKHNWHGIKYPRESQFP